MKSGTQAPRKGVLRLVHSVRQSESAQRLAWEKISSREFHAGSFEELLKRRQRLFKEDLEVTDAGIPVESEKKRLQLACQVVTNCIKERDAILVCSNIDQFFLTDVHKRLVSLIIENYITTDTDKKILLSARIKQVREEISEHLLRVSRKPVSVETIMFDTQQAGVQIHNSDVVRLLLYQINHLRTFPRLIALPNKHQPSNPFVLWAHVDTLLPSICIRILRLFDH